MSIGVAVAAEDDDWEPRVARVGFVEGDVSYLNADADEWTAVDVNAPLATGDRFYAGPGAKAEIQLPGGVYARVSEETELDLLELSDEAVHVRVGIGTATFRLRDVPAGQHVEFSTPATAVVARTRGVYRIDVADDGVTTVLVRDGEADAHLGEERYRLGEDRGARFAAYGEGSSDDEYEPVEVFDASYVEPDPWDEWESERAARLQNAVSYQYVDDDVYGVADLDQYGDWDRHEDYGPIWRPRHVSSGWAPFTNGRWVWQDPWGWTWVDYEPWGWAPSHYGRWVFVQDYWAWAPGPVVARPVYAPATVGFLGVSVHTPSVSVSVGIGSGPSVGWVPLGWGEPIIPWWRVGSVVPGRPWWGGWGGPRIVNNTVIKETNITNINVNDIRYVNLDRGRGFTAVDRESFVRGDLRRLDLPQGRLREIAHPLRGAPDIVPQRESLFAVRPAKLRERRVQPPREALQRTAVSTRALPEARPAFEKKRELIAKSKGQPVPPRELRRLARAEDGDKRAPVRTVAARGQRVVTPEINAEAPKQARGPIERRTRAARAGERRDTLQVQRGERGEAADPRAGVRAADDAQRGDERAARRALPERQERAATAPDARQRTARDARQRTTEDARQRTGEDARQRAERERTQPGRERATTAGRERTDGRDRPSTVARERRQPLDTPERGAPPASTREQVRRPDADPRAAARTQPERGVERPERAQREQAERTQREQAERTQRDAAQRERRASAERERARTERTQREQAQRTQAERAQREQAQRAQAERSRREQSERREREQVERQQREQAERKQRDAAIRQQRETEQRQRAQVERQQRQQAERVQSERRQREQAQRTQAERVQRERAQREQAQRAQAERVQRERAQREQAQRAQAERVQRERAQREQAQRQQAQRAQAERQRSQRAQVERQQREQAERAQVERQQRTRRSSGDDPRSAAQQREQSRRRQPRGGA